MTQTTEYGSLREKIAAEKAEREARYAEYERIYGEAWQAGVTAAEFHTPTPMIVSGYEDQPVMDGTCGFGWVNVRPGNSGFARWLVKTGRGRKAYEGGIQVWISAYGQSYERKTEHARAMAAYLSEQPLLDGLRIYGTGRQD